MIINTNPEFGVELTLVLPYAYWLHTQGKLEKVITSKGMKPFYYFCDDVEERYDQRTVDNEAAGLNEIPNNWIYGSPIYAELYKDEWPGWEFYANNKQGCGILDYSQWKMPDFNTHFKNDKFVLDKPHIVISNRYNWEHGHPPQGFFSVECLYNIFNYLTESGYVVIYKRPKNTEFPLDQNEIRTVLGKEELTANVEGVGIINDFQLTKHFKDVYLFDDLVTQYPEYTYNEIQINFFVNASGFISMGGGSTLFPCFFQKPTISYFSGTLIEARRDWFWEDSEGNKNIKNYHFMINPDMIPFVDVGNNYVGFLDKIKEIWGK